MSVTTLDPYAPDGRDTALWSVAALVVAAAHIGVVVGYMLLRPAQEGIASAPAINVAFMPATSLPSRAAAQAAPAEPTPQVEQAEPATRQAVVEPAPQNAEPVPQPEPAAPSVVLATPEPLPPPAPIEQPTAALPPPPAAKPATKPSPQAAKPVAMPERVTHKPARDDKAEKDKEKKETERRKGAQQNSLAMTASAPNRSADSEGSRAGRSSWNSELAAHIRRNATYSSDGNQESGVAQISVTIDRNGRLLSHRLAASSGSPTLDRVAMAVIERAQPFPPFPAGMTQAQVSLIIPLRPRPR